MGTEPPAQPARLQVLPGGGGLPAPRDGRSRRPRAPELDALLDDLDGLRHRLGRDLTLADAAQRAGEPGLATWLVQESQREVHEVEQVGLERLRRAARRSRIRRALPVASLAAAAAVIAVLASVAPPQGAAEQGSTRVNAAAIDSYVQLSRLAAGSASAGELAAAAAQFHADLAPLMAAATRDPVAAARALALVESERAVLASGQGAAEVRASLLLQADLLVARLRSVLPSAAPTPAPLAGPSPGPTPHPSSGPSSAATSPRPPSPAPAGTTSASPAPASSPGQAGASPTPSSPGPSGRSGASTLPAGSLPGG